MENENLDLDAKPAGNKDFWLFLLTVDIVFLCIFGFFLYKHFSANLFQPAAVVAEGVIVEEDSEEPEDVISVEAVEVQEMTAPVPSSEPEPKPVVIVPQEVPLTAVLEPKPEPQAEPAKPEPTPAAQTPVKEQKESVVIVENPKSKYRKVTFRWFGEGNQVSIVSGFTMSKPQPLKKQGDHWETTLSIAPGTYKFLYIVDGAKRKDPYSPEKDGRSLLEIK